MTRIGLLGPGTFSEESALYFLNSKHYQFISFRYISDVIDATISKEVDYGVLPVENTMEGSVGAHLDLLVSQKHLTIKAEWIYPIHMHLIGYKKREVYNELECFHHIQKVYSHHVVPSQCSMFLKKYLSHSEFEPVSHTAEGARLIALSKDDRLAAIGPKISAKLYGLDLLVTEIQNHKDNQTRFLLIGHHDLPQEQGETLKTTILVTLPEDFPGALHQMLSSFASRKINLSKIESRPTKVKLGSYYFYIDIEESITSQSLQHAIKEIEVMGCQVRFLGSYPSFRYDKS